MTATVIAPGTATPPCSLDPDLFASTDLVDHTTAARVCARCPMFTGCQEQLERAAADARAGGRYGPQGTWAGRLVLPERRRKGT